MRIKVTIEIDGVSFTAESKKGYSDQAFANDVLGVFAGAMDGMTYSEQYEYFYKHGDGAVREGSRGVLSKKTKRAIKAAWDEYYED